MERETLVGSAARRPYVGEGADGARRSAQIDRDEAATLEPGERRQALMASAARWDRIARELEDDGA